MFCQGCGAPLSPGSTFCARCGRPASAKAPLAFERPGVVTLLAVVNFIAASLFLLYAVAMGAAAMGAKDGAAVLVAVGVILAAVALLQVATGIGLLGLKAWGRTLQIVLAIVEILPCGMIIPALILYYMFKPGVRILFSERSPRQLNPQELALVDSLGKSSAAMVVVVGVVIALVGVAMIGIIAAIAIPSLLRARVSANESATLGDVRTIISAQATYQRSNGGFYDTLECLHAPAQCLPSYPATDPSFLDSTLAAGSDKSGYRRTFHPGPPAPAEVVALGQVSPSSVTQWAYVAVPIAPNQTGVRAFCGDSTGRLCFTLDGSAPPVEDGLCAMDCQVLQ